MTVVNAWLLVEHIGLWITDILISAFPIFRYSAYGVRPLADEHSPLITGAMDTSIDNSWCLLPSQTSTFSVSSYPMLGNLSELDQNTICSLPKVEREPLSFFGSDYVTVDSGKQENQTLRPFFDE